MINARGHRIDYNYFPWGGLEKVEYFNTDTTVQRTVSYAYDHNGNITNVIDDSIQATPLYTFTYDVLNRPDQTTVGYLPSSVTLNNDYDRYGNRDQFTLNDGSAQVHSFNYNKLNQLAGATLPGSQVFGFDYYDGAGSLRTLTYPSGITTDYQYEDNGPVKQILTRRSDGTTVVEQLDYTYDNTLNVETLTSANDGVYDYGYDPLDHLTTADYPTAVESQGITDETFSYDKLGNRINTGYDYNGNHQITQSPGTANYAFDNDGNMISKAGGFTYGYNKDNRLTSFTDTNNSANDATYQYDPFGRRISKTVNGATMFFLWEGTRLIGEYNASGARTKRYAYLPNDFSPIQIEDANGVYNVHYDHLQTPRFLTDSSQTIVWSQVQEAFGAFTVDGNPDGDGHSIAFNVRFPGQYFDEESGLHYNYFRDYDPSLGRYLQADPIGIVGGLNIYLYGSANPKNSIDIFGLSDSSIPVCITTPLSPLTLRDETIVEADGKPRTYYTYRFGFSRLQGGGPVSISPSGVKPSLSVDPVFGVWKILWEDTPWVKVHYLTTQSVNQVVCTWTEKGPCGEDIPKKRVEYDKGEATPTRTVIDRGFWSKKIRETYIGDTIIPGF